MPSEKAEPAQQLSAHSYAIAANNEKMIMAARALQNSVKKTISRLEKETNLNIFDLCVECDQSIDSEVKSQYPKLQRGVSFPTCISRDTTACHYSPFSRLESDTITAGNLIKIEAGCHVDNFPVYLSHTMVVPQPGDDSDYLREHAEPMLALNHIREACLLNMQPGRTAETFIRHANLIAESLNCTLISDVASFNVSRDPVVQKSKMFHLNPSAEYKKDSFKVPFDNLDVFNVEVLLTKTKPEDGRKPVSMVLNEALEPTVYKIPDGFIDVKSKQANQLRSQIITKFGYQAFNTRNLFTDSKPNLSWSVLKKVIEEMPVSKAANNQKVYHLKMTVQVKDKKAKVIAAITPDLRPFKKLVPEYTLPAEVQKFFNDNKKPAGKQPSN